MSLSQFQIQAETCGGSESGRPPAFGEVTFSTFIISLWQSAMEQVEPEAGAQPDLDLVKNVIDVMAMLKAKTSGCLDDDENALLEGLLYELRMKYLLKSK